MHHLDDYGGQRFEMGYASAIATILFFMMIGSNLLVTKILRKVARKMAKLEKQSRTAQSSSFKRSVTRSVGGDIGIYIILAIFGVIMVLPLVYAIAQLPQAAG